MHESPDPSDTLNLTWKPGDPIIKPPRKGENTPPAVSARPCDGCGDGESFPLSVSVIIPCGPGYGRWVYEAAASAKRQGVLEVIVVFDSCPKVPMPAEVRSFSVDYKNVQRTRRYGVSRAAGDAVLFLDADDVLPDGFAISAAKQLHEANTKDPTVAGVYPSARYIHITTGERHGGNRIPPEWDRAAFQRLCFMVISTLTLRRALVGSWYGTSTHKQLEDHAMWLELVRDGWRFQKGRDLYLTVRTHPDSLSRTQASPVYSVSMDIAHKPTTLFMALSGRREAWDRIEPWLQKLPSHVRLVLCDDSGDETFYSHLRTIYWEGRDVRLYRSGAHTEPPVMEDRNQASVSMRVEYRVCRLYNRAVQECTTEFLWFLEDDVLPTLPPEGCLRELASGFTSSEVAAVSGVYMSRYIPHIVAWTGAKRSGRQYVKTTPDRYMAVDGCGFGCVLARTDSLRRVPLSVTTEDWFDPFFWTQLRRLGEVIHLANRVRCIHMDPQKGDITPPQE